MQYSSLDTIPSQLEVETLAPDVLLTLVEVKGGNFTMGDDDSLYSWEKPAHLVQVNDFWIGQCPITNQQYAAFLNTYGSTQVQQGTYKGQQMIVEHEWGCHQIGRHWKPSPGYEQHPVINLTWFGAHEFCQWLSAKTNKYYRLPSEAQWEYAARGGQDSLGFPYAGSHKLKEVAWYLGNSHSEPKPVGLKKTNELGLFDMTGNVWEWCMDHYHGNYGGAPEDDSPWIDSRKTTNQNGGRVVRGGSWGSSVNVCRVWNRIRDLATDRSLSLGFRVVQH